MSTMHYDAIEFIFQRASARNRILPSHVIPRTGEFLASMAFEWRINLLTHAMKAISIIFQEKSRRPFRADLSAEAPNLGRCPRSRTG
jgi:hypothetical protein